MLAFDWPGWTAIRRQCGAKGGDQDRESRWVKAAPGPCGEEGKAILGGAEGVVRGHALQPESARVESIGGRAADLIVEQANARQIRCAAPCDHHR